MSRQAPLLAAISLGLLLGGLAATAAYPIPRIKPQACYSDDGKEVPCIPISVAVMLASQGVPFPEEQQLPDYQYSLPFRQWIGAPVARIAPQN